MHEIFRLIVVGEVVTLRRKPEWFTPETEDKRVVACSIWGASRH